MSQIRQADSREIPSSAEDLERLGEDLGAVSARWSPRAGELHGFLERWESAWGAYDLDALEQLVTQDITWDDPAMHGQTVHGRAQFRAFTETFFGAFPDVAFEGIGTPFVDLGGAWLGIRWRMSGSFTGELAIWGADPGAAMIPPTGNTFELEGVDLYDLHDGQVRNYSIVYDLLEFSQQLGLFS